MNPFYPEIISELPEADIPFNGVRGWLSQGKDHQIVFFEIEPIGEVAAHKHGAQWGAVFDGEMELTIGGGVLVPTERGAGVDSPAALQGSNSRPVPGPGIPGGETM